MEDSRASRLALAGWRISDPLPGGSVTESGTSPPDPTETEEKSDSMPAARFTPRAGVMADGEISAVVRFNVTGSPRREKEGSGKPFPVGTWQTTILSACSTFISFTLQVADASLRLLVPHEARAGLRSARARLSAAAARLAWLTGGGGSAFGIFVRTRGADIGLVKPCVRRSLGFLASLMGGNSLMSMEL